jgi:hypothetical protein
MKDPFQAQTAARRYGPVRGNLQSPRFRSQTGPNPESKPKPDPAPKFHRGFAIAQMRNPTQKDARRHAPH